MKRFLVLLSFLLLCGITKAATPTLPTDYDFSVKVIGEVIRPYDITITSVTVADTNLTSSTRSWGNLNIGTKFKPGKNQYGSMEFAFVVDGNTLGGSSDYNDPCGATFNFKIYATRWFGSAVVVCSGTATCGQLICSNEPGTADCPVYASATVPYHKWVSGITSFTKSNAFGIQLIDYTASDNGLSRIKIFDAQGYGAWWAEVTAITGNPGRIKCVASGW